MKGPWIFLPVFYNYVLFNSIFKNKKVSIQEIERITNSGVLIKISRKSLILRPMYKQEIVLIYWSFIFTSPIFYSLIFAIETLYPSSYFTNQPRKGKLSFFFFWNGRTLIIHKLLMLINAQIMFFKQNTKQCCIK